MKKSVLSLILLSSLLLVACQQKSEPELGEKKEVTTSAVREDKSKSSSENSVNTTMDEEKNLATSLLLDPSTVSEQELNSFASTPFKLSSMVKDVVGTYRGISYTNSFAGNELYELRIKEDGTYFKVTRPFMPKDWAEDSNKVYYLDNANTMQVVNKSASMDGKDFVYDDHFSVEQGVLVEKFGKLHFISLYYKDLIDYYYNQDGSMDLGKSFVSATMDLQGIPDKESRLESYAISLYSNYEKEFFFEEDSDYIMDGKIFFGETELTESNEVSQLVSEDLDRLVTPDHVKDILNSPNGLFQVTLHGGWDDLKVSEFTDYDKIFEKDSEKAKVSFSIRDKNSGDIYVYQPGKVKYADELNGTFVLRDYN
ncbi:hypothetical protein [Streptococcus sp. S784/96/1]|uniref:hypothetical protein n=1 Tax=Streptococcus sp. S784/96/1 TaxID=2653499 RepID=UPI001386EA05|nr:hypothetical protein [Streptococcus sp. S784/96/1]